MKKIIPLVVVAAFTLQACGGSSSKSNTLVPENKSVEVHHIQPDDVAAYVEKFKLQQAQLQLQFDGEQSAISFVDDSFEERLLYVKYDRGLAKIGFDMDKEEPVNTLELLEGDTSDLQNFEVSRILQGVDIEVTEDDDNYIYSGSVVDSQTQDTYNVRLVFNEALLGGGNSTLVVNGNQASLFGSLGTQTYIQIQDMINNENVDTLVFADIDGSVNDAINMHTGRLIRAAGLTTLMPTGGQAYSGGVDLFAAGVRRIYQSGGKLGVHSWCCSQGKPANELGVSHPAHGAQLTYFREMLGDEKGPEFYFFTINAAPFSSVHVMTAEELNRYTLITE